jgi:hypothetical protein
MKIGCTTSLLVIMLSTVCRAFEGGRRARALVGHLLSQPSTRELLLNNPENAASSLKPRVLSVCSPCSCLVCHSVGSRDHGDGDAWSLQQRFRPKEQCGRQRCNRRSRQRSEREDGREPPQGAARMQCLFSWR